MELIRISDCKLKIMLTPTDMCLFDLDEDSFSSDGSKMQKSFKLLLEEIHRQTGFSTDTSQISIQYFPSRSGGCEMFLSRLPRGNDRLPIPKNVLPPSQKKKEPEFHKDCSFRFASMEALLSACRRLQKIGYVGESSVYQDDKNRYHLYLSTLSPSPIRLPEEYEFLCEYAKREVGNDFPIFLAEHGKIICKSNAVRIFSDLC